MTDPIYEIRLSDLMFHPDLDGIDLMPSAAVTLIESDNREWKENGGEMSVSWTAWVAEIREHGIREPLWVVPNGKLYYVIDGRHRLTAAEEIGLATVPCRIAKPEALMEIAEGSVIGRRHWTKSQLAWAAVILHPEIADEGRQGGDKKSKRTECALITIADLAARYGVSERLMSQAVQMHRLLTKFKPLRAKYVASLWGGSSLKGLLQGFTAETDDENPTGPGKSIERHPVGNLTKIWVSERAHAANWAKLPDARREVLACKLADELAKMPKDYVAWKLEILQEAINKEGAGA